MTITDPNYTLSGSGTGSMTINPKPVTVTGGTFSVGSCPCAAAVPAPSGAYTVRYTSSAPVYDSSTPPTAVGNYNYTVTITDLNYVLGTGGTGTIQIT